MKNMVNFNYMIDSLFYKKSSLKNIVVIPNKLQSNIANYIGNGLYLFHSL